MRGKSIIACYDSTSIVKRSQHNKQSRSKNKRDLTFKPQKQRPQRRTPPKSHRTMHYNAHSYRNNHPTKRPHLSTHSSSFKSRTQMKITCSACSCSFFVLHTMRGTHDKVTCSRHTRKEQPFGYNQARERRKCKAPTSCPNAPLFSSLIPKSQQDPTEKKEWRTRVFLLPSRWLVF